MTFEQRPRREIWIACAGYAGLLCLAYGNVIFLGKSLVYSDNSNPFDPRFSSESYGKGFVPERVWVERNLIPTANFHDPGATLWQWEPGGEFLRKAIRDGEMPFWDPYIGGGVPSMSNQTLAYFFPPSFILVLLGNTSFLKNLYFLGIAFFGGLFTFLLIRRHDVSFVGSLAGGAAFMFSGGISQNIGSFIGQTAACIPLTLLATSWFFDRPTRGRMAGLAGIYAGVSLASCPPVLAQVFGAATLYAIARFVFPDELARAQERARTAVRWIASASLGAVLVAWYYIPAFTLLKSTPQVAEAYSDAARTSFPLLCLFQLLSPTLMGGAKIYAHPPLPDPFFLELPYLGVVALVLALLASPKDGRRRLLGTFACVAAILVVLKLFGVPPVQWIAKIPGLRTVHFAAYFGIVLDFLLAVLAGLGLDSLLRGEVRSSRAWISVGAVMVALLALRQNAIEAGVHYRFDAARWQRQWLTLLAFSMIASVLILLGTLMRGRKSKAVAIGAALALLAGVEGARNASYPRQYRWDVWRHPVPYVRKLVADAGFSRCFVLGALPANTNSPFGIFSLDSLMTFNPPRMHALYHRYARGARDAFLREPAEIPPEPVLDSASISYVVVGKDFSWALREAAVRDYSTAFDDGAVAIFRRPSLPRYFFTTDYRIRDAASALEDLAAYAPARQVIAQSPLTFSPQPNPTSDPAVTIREFHRNSFALSVVAPRPGLLVCSENDFPGWTATVNGRAARILPVNFAFRGVEIPAGRVVIRFRYWPPGLAAGSALSILGLAVLGVLWVWRRKDAVLSTSVGDDLDGDKERASAM